MVLKKVDSILTPVAVEEGEKWFRSVTHKYGAPLEYYIHVDNPKWRIYIFWLERQKENLREPDGKFIAGVYDVVNIGVEGNPGDTWRCIVKGEEFSATIGDDGLSQAVQRNDYVIDGNEVEIFGPGLEESFIVTRIAYDPNEPIKHKPLPGQRMFIESDHVPDARSVPLDFNPEIDSLDSLPSANKLDFHTAGFVCFGTSDLTFTRVTDVYGKTYTIDDIGYFLQFNDGTPAGDIDNERVEMVEFWQPPATSMDDEPALVYYRMPIFKGAEFILPDEIAPGEPVSLEKLERAIAKIQAELDAQKAIPPSATLVFRKYVLPLIENRTIPIDVIEGYSPEVLNMAFANGTDRVPPRLEGHENPWYYDAFISNNTEILVQAAGANVRNKNAIAIVIYLPN